MSRPPIKTLKIRVRDKHIPVLRTMAREVNLIWNYSNDLANRAWKERRIWMRAYDFDAFVKGASPDFVLTQNAINEVCHQYAQRRSAVRRSRLAWRVSNQKSPRRSLGWVPFRRSCATWQNGCVKFAGHHFKVWDSYGLSQYDFRSGSFNEDARGRWYFNVAVHVDRKPSCGRQAVGIDLGIKDIATGSDGEKLSGRWYRDLEPKLTTAQRAGNKRRVRAIRAKAANRRKDALHKFSRRLVNRSAAIFVGNVRTPVKTRMAKAALDSGWGMLRTMLDYKCDHAGVVFEVVNEAYTTQACSECGSISGPKGREGLGVRGWTCQECGALHDRDVNAARNILALGHQRLGGGSARAQVSIAQTKEQDHE